MDGGPFFRGLLDSLLNEEDKGDHYLAAVRPPATLLVDARRVPSVLVRTALRGEVSHWDVQE
eukprot:4748786-Prymnesium_polylepis.1